MLPIVYTIRGCDACVKLLHKWDAEGVAYEERRVELNQATLDEARRYGMMVPSWSGPTGVWNKASREIWAASSDAPPDVAEGALGGSL